MSDIETSRGAAEARVQQFMADYDAEWRRAAPAFDRDRRDPDVDPFELWRERMAETTRAHFIERAGTDLGSSFSNPPEYGPAAEQIVDADVEDGVAYVRTRSTSPLPRIHEYVLHEQGGDWRIAGIEQYFGDPTQPFVSRADAEARLDEVSPTAAFGELPDAQARLDETHNFTEREVTVRGETTTAEVSSVGTLVTSSGVLSVLDFGYDNDDARPLARSVAPGAYPVDRVTGFGRNAAVRVRFSDHDPVAWHPAAIPGSGHVFGVDAGSACIVDHVAYASMTKRAKAARYAQFVAAPRPAAVEVSLDAGDTGIVVDSGYGDGSYPAYWGVDADGEVSQLVVDFMLLVDEDEDGTLVHR